MTPVSALDVRAELSRRLGGGLGKVKGQKLLYYCQAWSLAWFDRPLFREEIEAWQKGPVVTEVFHRQKVDLDPPGDPLPDDDEIEAVVSFVFATYGEMTGAQLISCTHQEPPYANIYVQGHNNVIAHESMAAYYRSTEHGSSAHRWLSGSHPAQAEFTDPAGALAALARRFENVKPDDGASEAFGDARELLEESADLETGRRSAGSKLLA